MLTLVLCRYGVELVCKKQPLLRGRGVSHCKNLLSPRFETSDGMFYFPPFTCAQHSDTLRARFQTWFDFGRIVRGISFRHLNEAFCARFWLFFEGHAVLDSDVNTELPLPRLSAFQSCNLGRFVQVVHSIPRTLWIRRIM